MRRVVWALCRLFLAAILAIPVASPASAQTVSGPSPVCDGYRTQMTDLDKSITDLEKAQAPVALAKKLTATLDPVIQKLKDAKKDAKNSIVRFDQAQKTVDDIEKQFKDLGIDLPQTVKDLKKSFDKFATGIPNMADKKSASSEAYKAFTDATKRLDDTTKQLENLRDAINAVTVIADARNGSGADQIRVMKSLVDTAIKYSDGVPGLKPLLTAYSNAIGSIATSWGKAETAYRNGINQFGTDLEGFPNGIKDVLPGYTTGRDKAAQLLASLKAQKAELAAKMAGENCNAAPSRPDPCDDAKTPVNQARQFIDKGAKPQQNSLEAKTKAYDSAVKALRAALQNQPAGGITAAELNLINSSWRLSQFDEDAATNSNAVQDMEQLAIMANDAGITLPAASHHDRSGLVQQLAAYRSQLGQKQQAAQAKGQADYDAQFKQWQQQIADLQKAAQDAQVQMAAAQDAWNNVIGAGIMATANTNHWTQAQSDQFDRCYPAYKTAHQAALNGQRCNSSGGGLLGALNGINCQVKTALPGAAK